MTDTPTVWRLKMCEIIGHRWTKPRWSEPNDYGDRSTIDKCRRCGHVRFVQARWR